MIGCMMRNTGRSMCQFCGEQPPSKGPGFMATLPHLSSHWTRQNIFPLIFWLSNGHWSFFLLAQHMMPLPVLENSSTIIFQVGAMLHLLPQDLSQWEGRQVTLAPTTQTQPPQASNWERRKQRNRNHSESSLVMVAIAAGLAPSMQCPGPGQSAEQVWSLVPLAAGEARLAWFCCLLLAGLPVP